MNPGGPPDIDMTGFGVVALLLLVAGLALWWWRVRPGTASGGPIRLIALRPLGGKRMLALVEVEEEKFLLGMTDAQISCLGRLEGGGEGEASRLQRQDGEAA